jgi:signal transduction histidine kinase
MKDEPPFLQRFVFAGWAELHGGSIVLTNRPQGGLAAMLILPRAAFGASA